MPSPVSPFEPVTVQAIQRALSTSMLGRTLHVHDEVPSTNTLAMTLAQDGAPHGTVVVADRQTAGRGRLGRHWHSPSGKNLHCSILLRMNVPTARQPLWLSWVPLIAALATSRAVQTVAGLKSSVKWPNDIMIADQKLAGILCESSGLGTDEMAVIAGIGLNVNIRREEFPDELRAIATSVAIDAGRPWDRTALLAALLLEFETRCEAFLAGHHGDILTEYMVRCATVGQRVRVELAQGNTLQGRAQSVQPDGSLRVAQDDGTTTDVRTGDVFHVR
ncbi:MAG: biotin--[acetyl-CoA-carboxylase] ligase [Nitrospira sp.]